MGYGVVEKQLDGTGENVERGGTVLPFTHQDFAGAIFLTRDGARKLIPDLFSDPGKIGDGSQLLGSQELPSQIRR